MSILLCIGGPGRSGKSTLSRMVTERLGIPYTSFDFTTTAVKYALAEKWQMEPNEVYYNTEYGAFCSSLLEPFLMNIMRNSLPYLVDSARLTPEMLFKLQQINLCPIHTVFMGYKDISVQQKLAELHETPEHPNADWFLKNRTRQQQEDHIEKGIEHSKRLAESAEIYGFKYIDTSHTLPEKLEKAFEYLAQASILK